jgi:ubiquinone/menaquinone biosynthesis C-methylase UbiE
VPDSTSYYDNLAPRYAQVAGARAKYLDAVDNFVFEQISDAGPVRLLDIGAGDGVRTGKLAASLPPDSYVCALEPSREMFALLRQRDGISDRINCSLEVSGFESQFTHALALWNVIGHVPDLKVFLGAAYKALMPEGVLVLDFNSRFNSRAYGHVSAIRNALASVMLPRDNLGKRFVLPASPSGEFVTLFALREVVGCLTDIGFGVVRVGFFDYETGVATRSERTGQPVVVAAK